MPVSLPVYQLTTMIRHPLNQSNLTKSTTMKEGTITQVQVRVLTATTCPSNHIPKQPHPNPRANIFPSNHIPQQPHSIRTTLPSNHIPQQPHLMATISPKKHIPSNSMLCLRLSPTLFSKARDHIVLSVPQLFCSNYLLIDIQLNSIIHPVTNHFFCWLILGLFTVLAPQFKLASMKIFSGGEMLVRPSVRPRIP